MKHRYYILALLAAMLLPWAAGAQAELTVCEGTATNANLPLRAYSSGWQTEMVYPASMLSDITGAPITKLTFYANFSTSTTTAVNGTCTVRIGEVQHQPYTSDDDMELTSSSTTYFSGSLSIVNGLLEITLDNPYIYAGGDLAINIFNPSSTSGISSSNYYLGTTYTQYNAGYDWAISSPSWTIYSKTTFLPKCTFTYTTSGDFCYGVRNLRVTYTSDEATLTWVDTMNLGATYTVQTISGTDTNTVTGLTDTSYTATNLTPNTPYTFRVKVNCSATSESSWAIANIRTACIAIDHDSLPWIENFESYTASSYSGSGNEFGPSCWTVLNRYSSSYPYVSNNSSYAPTAGGKYLCIYSYSSPATIVALPLFDDDLTDLYVRFKMRTTSTTNGVDLGVMSDPNNASTFTTIRSYFPTATNTWEQHEGTLDTFSTGYIALRYNGGDYYSIYIDDITVSEVPTCVRPSISISDIAARSASLHISDPNYTGSYQVVIGTDTTNVTTDSIALTDLVPYTAYTVKVWTVCSDGTLEGPATTTFTTTLESTSLPYSCGFEQGEDSLWAFMNSNTNRWMIGSNTNNGGSRSLYITSNGTTNSYDNSYGSTSYAVRAFEVTEAIPLGISFDWKGNGESGYDYLRAWIAPATATFTAGSSTSGGAGWISLGGGDLRGQTTWQNLVTETDTLAAGNYYLVFMWTNDYSDGTNPPAAVDNVQIVASTCARPGNLTLDTVDASSITFHWSSQATDFLVTIDSIDYWVSDTTYTATGLDANTAYMVKVSALCGSDTSLAITASYRTACDDIVIPYNEGFENGGELCWNMQSFYTSYASYTSLYSSQSHTGNYSYRFYTGHDYQPAFAVSPRVDDINTLMVSFYTKASSTNVKLQVGTMDSPTDTTTFRSIYTVASVGSTWTMHEVNFSQVDPDSAHYIAFRYGVTSSYGYSGYLDDVSIIPIPSCVRPVSVSVRNVTEDSATVNINDTASAMSYHIYVVNGTDTAFNQTVYDSVYIVTGLSASSSYVVYATTVCTDGTETAPVTMQFNTACGAVTAPWSEDFTTDPFFCWVNLDLDNNTTDNWRYSTSGYATSSYNGSNDANDWLITPAIVLPSSADGLTLKWDDMGESYYDYDYYEEYYTHMTVRLGVGSSTDTGNFTTVLFSDDLPDTWTSRSASLANYAGDTIRIAFIHDSYNDDGASVDNVSISQVLIPSISLSAPAQANTGDTVLLTTTLHEGSTTGMFYTWSSTLGTISSTTDSATIVYTTGGTDTIVVIATNNYGSDTATAYITVYNCSPITTLPWTEGFESYATTSSQAIIPCWNYLCPTGDPDNTASIVDGSSRAHGGQKSLRFNGEGNGITPSPIMILPAFNDDISGLQLTFWAVAENTTNSGTLKIGYITNINADSTFVPVVTLQAADYSNYGEVEVTFAGAPSGSRIAIAQLNSDYYWWWVDDLTVNTAPSCTRPTISISSIDSASATLAINDANNENHYMLYWGTADSAEVNDTVYTIYNLQPGTSYTVRANTICADGSRTNTTTLTFMTNCAEIATLPWTEGFESYQAGYSSSTTSRFDDPCWRVYNRYSANYPYVYNSSSYVHSGSNCLNFYGASSPATILVLPSFADSLGGLQLSFWMTSYYSNNAVEAGYMTDKNDQSTFVRVQNCALTSTSTYELFEVLFPDSAYGNIALRYNYSYSGYSLYIDDITVDVAPSCTRPSSAVVSNITSDSATLTIADPNNLNHYVVVLTSGGTVVDSSEVTGNSRTYTTLSPSTAYTVSVRTICADGTINDRVLTTTFVTACGDITTLPWTENFDGLSTGQYADIPCWGRMYCTNGVWGTDPSMVMVSSGSSNCLRISSYYEDSTPDTGIAVLPGFAPAVNQLKIDFAISRGNGTESDFFTELGVITNGNDMSSFVPVDTISPITGTSGTSWMHYSYDFSNYTGGDGKIAVRFTYLQYEDYWWVYIDSVEVDYASGVGPQPANYTVSASSANSTMGSASVTPSGTVAEGTTVTFTATANTNYRFVNWTNEAGTVISTANPYTTTVSSNLSLTANFEADDPNTTYYNVVVRSENNNMGTVSSTASGRVAENTSVTVTATPAEGYTFISWTDGTGATLSTDNPYTFTVTSDITLTAHFENNEGIDGVNASALTLYPNPATSSVTIALEGRAEVSVIDQSGRTVQRTSVDGKATLNLEGMAKGAYYVRAVSESGIAVRKLIVK